MSSEINEPWRPTGGWLLRGSAVSFLIGSVIGALIELGGSRFDVGNLAWSGLVGLLIFLIVCGLLALVLHRVLALGGLSRAAVLAGLFFVSGAVAWVAVLLLAVAFGEARLPISWPQVARSIALDGVLAILFGSAFYLYELTRQRMLESVSRLKDAGDAERELELARSIQRRLLPATELEGDGYRIAARNLPATFVAGDFYDVFALSGGAIGLVVADVAGKGIGASLIMASAKAVLPLLATQSTVEETMAAMNRKLCEELEARQFVALCYACYQPASGELILANAGLPDPYMLRAGRAPEALSVTGPRMPLGLRRQQAYRASSSALAPGECLLLFTDGLPEAPTTEGEPLGYEALTALIPPLGTEPGAWLDALFAGVDRATGAERTDDWTALLLERKR